MSIREEFEKNFPVPFGVKWGKHNQDYTYEAIRFLQITVEYSKQWKAWQAACAQQGRSGEAFAWCFTDVNGRPSEFCDHPKHAADGDTRIRTPLYTHPQPAQQGSVSGVGRMADVLGEWVRNTTGVALAHVTLVDMVRVMLATLQPEGDGWFCSTCGMKRELEQCNGQQDDTCRFEKRPNPPAEQEGKLEKRTQPPLCEDEGCPQHGTPHVCIENGEHILYKDGDPDLPSCILDRNGEVVLDLCRRCGRGEAELVEACDAPKETR